MATFNISNQSNVTVSGTPDSDTFNLTGSGSALYINGLAGTDTVNGSTGYQTTTVVGGTGNDQVNGLGNFAMIFGNEGMDAIQIAGARSTVFGGQDNDAITTTAGNNQAIIFGNQGNDTIDLTASGAGSTVFGGQGQDSITGAGGSQYLSGDLGSDVITDGAFTVAAPGAPATNTAGSGNTLIGGQGQDILTVNGTNALVFGNEDDDRITTGFGAQGATVFGGQGSDTIVVSALTNDGITPNPTESDLIFGNMGNDRIALAQGTTGSTVFGGQGSDNITLDADAGNAGTISATNYISGDLGDDIINVGTSAQTTVSGGAGADRITGSDRQDRFAGGDGRDTFVVNGAGAAAPAQGADTVLRIGDFVSGTDLVSLSGTAAASTSNYSETTVNGGLTEARAAAASLSANSYLFVAGTNDGFLFLGGATAPDLTGVRLDGLNSINSFAATDIITDTPAAIVTPAMA